MTLEQLIRDIPGARVVAAPEGTPGPAALPIERVVHSAAAAVPGALFAAIAGARADGHDHAAEAVVNGAVALLVARPLPLPVTQVVVPDTRLALALAAAAHAGHPSLDLDVVGVTGTNGKTTCAFLVAAVMEAAGRPCGIVGTIEARVGGRAEPTGHTTPDPLALQDLLARMRAAGDRACAMEVSSHALAQRRVAGVRFAAALFTNLTRDHMDYHADVEDYYAAKRALFARPPGEGDDPPGAANLDDPHGARLARETGALGYAVEAPAPVRPAAVEGLGTGIRATIATPRGPVDIASRLRGRFNLSNLTGVVAVGELLELPHDAVAAGIAALPGVHGRFEAIEAGQAFPVIVDYAHTPDSLDNVLRAARELVRGGRLIVVFGCGGDRDRGKRPQMGAVARRLADVAVVTSDNPRTEEPDAIVSEILQGARGGPAEVVSEVDRRAAIGWALGHAGAGDLVLIAGKGHEQGQERHGVVTPFDDRVVAREILTEAAA